MAVTCDGNAPQFGNGSSTATSSFSGMAALVWSAYGPDATRQEIESAIKLNSTNPNGDHPDFGHGYLDVQSALLSP